MSGKRGTGPAERKNPVWSDKSAAKQYGLLQLAAEHCADKNDSLRAVCVIHPGAIPTAADPCSLLLTAACELVLYIQTDVSLHNK